MRVAVIGGGVFGCTIAVDLARAGAQVELFEARADILDGATARNQARLHSGYHYPRSDATAAAARDASVEFAARFPDEAIVRGRNYYVVARGSKTTPDEYLSFMDRLGLPYRIATPPEVHTAELVVRVPEGRIDVDILRRLLRRDLAQHGVRVRTGHRVAVLPAGFDLIVRATYGQPWRQPLRYEVCEVAFLELGRYSGDSYVVIDGEFVSLDPVGNLYALYDVKHSVHHVTEGLAPEVPTEYRMLLNRLGPTRTPLSRFEQMTQSASRFLWGLDRFGQGVCIYRGSLFSVRAVLPDVDATDERPTLVERDGDVISVLSGKICTAVTAAKQVTEMALVAA